MRNASEADVKKAIELGQLANDVMYKSHWGYKVHGVSNKVCAVVWGLVEKHYGDKCFLAETVLGDIILVEKTGIYPIRTGPSQQPKRIKRKPVKGTRPEKLIPMSADVKLKVGDKVVLANGKRATIERTDTSFAPYMVSPVGTFNCGWCRPDGSFYSWNDDQYNITHKVVPYSKWASPVGELFIDGKSVGQVADLKISTQQKSPEQEAFEKGYWVAHQAKPDSRVPPFASGHMIDYLMATIQSHKPEYAENLRWTQRNNGADIVAYRKAKQ